MSLETGAERRTLNRQLRNEGARLTVARKAYRVTLTAMDVPQWAKDIAIKAVSAGDRYVWLRSRGQARKLAWHDHKRGGLGIIDAMEYRRCPRCHGLLLGAEAAEAREWLQRHPGLIKRCGEDCQ